MRRGHQVRCFDLKTRANERAARKLAGQAEVIWGDLRHPEAVAEAVHAQEIVIHLAFVIPKLSTTGVDSEDHPEWARAINVGGTQHLLEASKNQQKPPRFLFTSSLHVYGRTQDQLPPRTVNDVPNPLEHYAHHKVACERIVKESGLEWTILRLAAALPVRLVLDPGMFEVPLDNRIEFIHTRDVGLAIANAIESNQVWGKTWLIGGGSRCQIYQRDLIHGVFEAVGLGRLPEAAFPTGPSYPTDWLDTTASQQVLKFQRHTLTDYIQEVSAQLGFRRYLIRLFRPLIRHWLLRLSPMWVSSG